LLLRHACRFQPVCEFQGIKGYGRHEGEYTTIYLLLAQRSWQCSSVSIT
jgi:hypothetical protein